MVGILYRAICTGKLLTPNLVPRILQERGFQNNCKEPGPSFSPNYPPRAKGCTIATGGGGVKETGRSFQSLGCRGPCRKSAFKGEGRHAVLRVKSSLPAHSQPRSEPTRDLPAPFCV